MRYARLSLLLSCATALACSGAAGSPTSPDPTTVAPVPTAGPSAPPPAAPSGPPTWDVDTQGLPRFVTHDYIDMARIGAISRFRSAEGHDYSDAFEACRSMKHYFRPAGSNAGTIAVFAPVSGTVVATIQEWAGVQIVIRPEGLPAFAVVLFHVNPAVPLAEGASVVAGSRIGTHIGDQTWSDVAVRVDTPGGFRLLSWFEVVTDAVFDAYRARGVASPGAAIISRAERDADPLSCQGGNFLVRGRLPGWVTLR